MEAITQLLQLLSQMPIIRMQQARIGWLHSVKKISLAAMITEAYLLSIKAKSTTKNCSRLDSIIRSFTLSQ